MPEQVRIIGDCGTRLFGLTPEARMRRQSCDMRGLVLVAHASAVVSEATLGWLAANPGVVLSSASGRPLAVAVEPGRLGEAEATMRGGERGGPAINPEQMPVVFVRKLRRQETLFVRSAADESAIAIERALFASVYKGVTDLVTKWLWPLPAFWVTRGLARMRVHPNAVTLAGLALTILAAVLWSRSAFAGGMAAAWMMTFLDTVDGKLARVTATSSELGNILDHVTDYVHPPVWWLCLAAGLAAAQPAAATSIWLACWVILGAYVLGRVIEELFKRAVGFNQYLWRRFDTGLRLVVSRRNVILLIMTVGLIAGGPVEAYVACAAWSVASVFIQAVRLVQALAASRQGPLKSWMM